VSTTKTSSVDAASPCGGVGAFEGGHGARGRTSVHGYHVGLVAVVPAALMVADRKQRRQVRVARERRVLCRHLSRRGACVRPPEASKEREAYSGFSGGVRVGDELLPPAGFLLQDWSPYSGIVARAQGL
jgi:hypothetical protein